MQASANDALCLAAFPEISGKRTRERADGSLAAIEVKTSDTITSSNFHGLKVLQSVTPNGFKCGVVLYSGKDVVPFGDSLFALPIDRLWLGPVAYPR